MTDAAGLPASASPAAVDPTQAGAQSRAPSATGDVPASSARPVAATWQSRPAAASWCPDELADVLPWAREIEYTDLAAREAHLEGWHLLAMSQRGRVHAHDGTHREDAVTLRAFPRGFVLAVADGAGSSRWSRVGAECACRAVELAVLALAREGADSLPGEVVTRALVDAVEGCCRSLQLAAERSGGEARDFRTTLLVALCVDDVLATLQVGDGAIVALAADGILRRLGVTDSGTYSGEVSAFLPEVDRAALERRVTVTSRAGLEAVLVVSDGIEDPFYPIERRGGDIFRQLYAGVQSPAEGFTAQRVHGPIVGDPDALVHLADWIAFERRGENDDRSLAGAFRIPISQRS